MNAVSIESLKMARYSYLEGELTLLALESIMYLTNLIKSRG